jgi:DNA polymerase III delta prime subunit
MLRFSPIDKDNLNKYLNKIVESENLTMSAEVFETINYVSNGDMRKAINLVQSVSLIQSNITSDSCYEISGYPSKKEIGVLFESIMDPKKFDDSIKILNDYVKNRKYSLYEITNKIAEKIFDNYKDYSFEENKLINLIDKLSDIHNQINYTFNDEIYIEAVVGIFYLSLI